MFMLWNETDQVFASPETFETEAKSLGLCEAV